jgi:hypothetical protein
MEYAKVCMSMRLGNARYSADEYAERSPHGLLAVNRLVRAGAHGGPLKGDVNLGGSRGRVHAVRVDTVRRLLSIPPKAEYQ